MKQVLEIKNICVCIVPTQPPTLQARVQGTVPGEGWSNGRLVPRRSARPPASGFYEFDFVADSPEPLVPARRRLIETEFNWQGFPDHLAGLRVNAYNNSMRKGAGQRRKTKKQKRK